METTIIVVMQILRKLQGIANRFRIYRILQGNQELE